MPREFLERMTVVETQAGALEGLFHPPSEDPAVDVPPAVVLPGVPGLGGTMEHAVLAEVTWAVSQRGAATLRVNYRGVGGSAPLQNAPLWLDLAHVSVDEVHARIESATRDASAALSHLVASISTSAPALIGYSFGALVAAQLALTTEIGLSRVVLIAPPLSIGATDLNALVDTGLEIDLLLPAADPLAPIAEQERAKAAGLWPRVIADADPGFVRGLSALGREVVQRGWSD